MNTSEAFVLAKVCNGTTRSEEEIYFLMRLAENVGSQWHFLSKHIPSGTLTSKNMFVAIIESSDDEDFRNDSIIGFKRRHDQAIAEEVIIPALKTLTLLPKSRKSLFMLFPELINGLNASLNKHKPLRQVVEPMYKWAYRGMMKLLREPHLSTWKDFEVINHNACYPGIDFKLALTQNQQVDVLTALNPLMRYEGELSVKNLCSQLISSGLINDKATASYQKSCGHINREFPAVMNCLALARIEKAGAFDALRALREGNYPLLG